MISKPAIIGVINRPDVVGPWPLTVCRYSGRNVTAPNSPAPTRNPIALLTLNTRLRNSLIGKIGSAALRSTSTNAASSTTPAATSASMNVEPHGYSLPPSVVYSTIADRPPASSVAPK